jgi:hypothetical protein
MVVDTLERRFNGTHVYAPVGVTMSRWPGFPGNDPNVNTTEYALDSFKSMWLLANTCDVAARTGSSSDSRLLAEITLWELSLAASAGSCTSCASRPRTTILWPIGRWIKTLAVIRRVGTMIG